LNRVITLLGDNNSCRILDSEGYNPLKGAKHDLGNDYMYILSFASLSNEGYEIPKEIGSIENLLSKGNTIEKTILSLIDEMNLSNKHFRHYENIHMKELYKDLTILPLSMNGKVKMEIRDGITSEKMFDIYKSAHLFRIIHNICKNKTRLSDCPNVLIDIKDKKDSYSFGIYDDTGIALPDRFKNPYDVCKKSNGRKTSRTINHRKI